jgi:hypothetical protein
MTTILRTQDKKSGQIVLFSFETSPLLNTDEQVKKVMKDNSLENYEVIEWHNFDAITLTKV